MATEYKDRAVGANDQTWTKMPEWWGNPDLGFDSYCKIIKRGWGAGIPIFVFGKDDKWSFCVSAGANSDLSYTGCIPGAISAMACMNGVDEKHRIHQLIR